MCCLDRVQQERCPNVSVKPVSQTELGALLAFMENAPPHASDDLGPDDPELVWGPITSRLHCDPPWRASSRFETEQVSAQLDDQTDNGSRRPAFVEQLCEPIADLLSLPRLRVLQAGCGVGNWIPFLRSRIPHLQYVGIDRSRKAIAEATMRFGKNDEIQLMQVDLMTRPKLGHFDLILMDYELLNHFSPLRAKLLVAWASSMLAPKGRIFGDIRLATDTLQSRHCRWRHSKFGIWYRRGLIRGGVEGRAAVFYKLDCGKITKLFQDVLCVPTLERLPLLFDGCNYSLNRLTDISTNKLECENTVSFVLRQGQ